MRFTLTTSLLLSTIPLSLTSAVCIGKKLPGGSFDASVEIGGITSAQVLAVAPETSSCSSGGGECSNADVVTKALNDAFATYGLKTLGQKAGMIAYMAFESGGFKWNTNQYPGRPGQGTKCMLMFAHLYNFAISFPELQDSVAQNSPGGKLAEVNYSNADSMFSDSAKNAIRALVLGDAYTFKGALWYLTSYPSATCDKNQLNNGYQGFVATMGAPCYSVTMDAERKARWCSAIKAIMPAGMAAPSDCA
ncbi:hypothetical protein EV426DRAFT_584496 [Tirmania nivea]|nr:hypothetical protein EV426DRAFT_584496 [Tirmania nivea]